MQRTECLRGKVNSDDVTQWPLIHCGIVFSFMSGNLLLITWDATKTSRKPTLTG